MALGLWSDVIFLKRQVFRKNAPIRGKDILRAECEMT